MESSTRRAARFDDPRQLSVTLAATDRDVDAAQRLRYRVFAGEMGARLSGPAAGRDEDEFDAWCEHLIVRDDRCGGVVGTYRVLTADRAARLGLVAKSLPWEPCPATPWHWASPDASLRTGWLSLRMPLMLSIRSPVKGSISGLPMSKPWPG